MTDRTRDANPDSPPAADTHPDSAPDTDLGRGDPRSDIEQVVEARSDAVDRGEGGPEPATMTDTGVPGGPAGDGGIVKNQDHDQQ